MAWIFGIFFRSLLGQLDSRLRLSSSPLDGQFQQWGVLCSENQQTFLRDGHLLVGVGKKRNGERIRDRSLVTVSSVELQEISMAEGDLVLHVGLLSVVDAVGVLSPRRDDSSGSDPLVLE